MHAERFIARRLAQGKSPHTVAREMRHLKATFNFAVRLGYIRVNPFVGIRPPKGPRKEMRVLSSEEVEKLIDVIVGDIEWTLLLRLLCETGARIGEIANLEFSDINIERGIVNIRVKDDWQTDFGGSVWRPEPWPQNPSF